MAVDEGGKMRGDNRQLSYFLRFSLFCFSFLANFNLVRFLFIRGMRYRCPDNRIEILSSSKV